MTVKVPLSPVLVDVTWGDRPGRPSRFGPALGQELWRTLALGQPAAWPVDTGGPRRAPDDVLRQELVSHPSLGVRVRWGRSPARVWRPEDVALHVVVAVLDEAGAGDPGFVAGLEAARGDPGLRVLPVVVEARAWGELLTSLEPQARVDVSALRPAVQLPRAVLEVALAVVRQLLALEPEGAAGPQRAVLPLLGVRLLPHHAADQPASPFEEHLRRLLVTDAALAAGLLLLDPDRPAADRSTAHHSAAAGAAAQPRVTLHLAGAQAAVDPALQRLLIEAKWRQEPLLTVWLDAVQTARTSPYLGNTPAIAGRPGCEEAVLLAALQAVLRHRGFAHQQAFLRQHLGLDVEVLPSADAPELLDLADPRAKGRGVALVLHPDPPLPRVERDLFAATFPNLAFATPSTWSHRLLGGHGVAPPLAGLAVGLSTSHSADLGPQPAAGAATGLHGVHQDELVQALAVHLLRDGAALVYGGDPRRGGFTEAVEEVSRAHDRLHGGPGLRVRTYDRATLEAGGVLSPSVAHARPVALARAVAALAGPDRMHGWHHQMRDQLAQDVDALVCVGGKHRPRTEADPHGYNGPLPGLLEEAWRALHAGKAVYALGGLGGAAALLAGLLLRGEPPAPLPLEASWPQRPLARAGREVEDPLPGDLRAVCADLARWGAELRALPAEEPWTNGLTRAENAALATAEDPTAAVHLVLRGLRQVADRRRRPDQPRLRLYPGTAESLHGAEVLALGVVPGVRPTGPMAVLDEALGGRLSARILALSADADPGPLELWPSDDAIGARWLVLLPLAMPGPDPTGVERSVDRGLRALLDLAVRRGVGSVAMVPLGRSLGLPLPRFAALLAEALRRAGPLPELVLCDSDPEAIDALEGALAPLAPLRLHAPAAPGHRLGSLRTRPELVLELRYDGAHLSSTLLGDQDARLASGRLPLAPEQLAALAGGTPGHAATPDAATLAARGRALADLLPADVRALLSDRRGAPLHVLHDDRAAQLPIEALQLGEGPDALLPATLAPLRRRLLVKAAPQRRAGGLGHPVRVLVVEGGTSGLRQSPAFAQDLAASFTHHPALALVQPTPARAGRSALLSTLALEGPDVLIFVGHARTTPSGRDQGLDLASHELLRPEDLRDAAQVPHLVLLIACQTGVVLPEPASPDPGSPDTIAEAFLAQGVGALLGTAWKVREGPALRFAGITCAELARGRSIGEAVLRARQRLRQDGDGEWAAFRLYGEPALRL